MRHRPNNPQQPRRNNAGNNLAFVAFGVLPMAAGILMGLDILLEVTSTGNTSVSNHSNSLSFFLNRGADMMAGASGSIAILLMLGVGAYVAHRIVMPRIQEIRVQAANAA